MRLTKEVLKGTMRIRPDVLKDINRNDKCQKIFGTYFHRELEKLHLTRKIE